MSENHNKHENLNEIYHNVSERMELNENKKPSEGQSIPEFLISAVGSIF